MKQLMYRNRIVKFFPDPKIRVMVRSSCSAVFTPHFLPEISGTGFFQSKKFWMKLPLPGFLLHTGIPGGVWKESAIRYWHEWCACP